METIKKLVFVSVPMNGKTDKSIEKSIELTKIQYLHINRIDAKDVEFIDGYHDVYQHLDAEGRKFVNRLKHKALFYLGHAIELMSGADEIVLGHCYDRARGCRIEAQVAYEYDIPMIKITKEMELKILYEMREEKKQMVKELKEKEGLSIKEIAERTKISEKTITKWFEEFME